MSKEYRPRLTEDEMLMLQGIRDACKDSNIGVKHVDMGWLKTKEASLRFKNPAYKSPEEEANEIDFDAIVSKYIAKIPLTIDPLPNSGYFYDRTVYTDAHVGMTPNENGFSLYGGKWDEDEIMHRGGKIASHTLEHQKSDILILDDLGDFMDGYDGETVRKGHKLPQNMDNETAFDIGLKFKLSKVDALAPKYKKIVCNNICNDNHAGSFGYIVNSAFKSVIEARYDNVTVNNHRSFISHYFMGNKCFIITHGKDGKNLKFGFKPVLDPKQIEKIESYIKHHKLYDYDIEFSKGDSHQFIFDYSTSDSFDYCNYPALSPSSEWVQTNFKKGSSGFVTFNYKENGEKSEHPYFFDWKNTNEEKSIDWASIAL